METMQLQQIKYGHRTVDTGFIIGYRKYMWLAKKRYYPLWAKANGQFINTVLYKKTADNIFYIPKSALKPGMVFLLFDKKQCDVPVRYKVLAVNGTNFNVEFLGAVKSN